MKKLRSLLCIVLAISMVLVFAACSKDGGGSDTGKSGGANIVKEDATADSAGKPNSGSSGGSSSTDSGKTETKDEDSGKTDAAPAEDTAGIPEDQLPDPNIKSTALHMFSNVDEYLNRPHEIQKGSSITLLCSDVPSYVPWNSTA